MLVPIAESRRKTGKSIGPKTGLLLVRGGDRSDVAARIALELVVEPAATKISDSVQERGRLATLRAPDRNRRTRLFVIHFSTQQ